MEIFEGAHDSQISNSPCLQSQHQSGNLAHTYQRRIFHPNQFVVFGGGMNHLQHMDEDKHANIHNNENLYYPFASKSEWEAANWLSSGALSQNNIDIFLRLQRVSTFSLSHSLVRR